MIQIRKASPEDAFFIVNSQTQLARETEHMELNHDVVTAGVNAVFADKTIGEYLVATVDGKLVGCLLVLPEWSDWRNGKVLWIHSLYVVPEYRKHGVFNHMYEFLKNRVSSSTQYRGLRLYVDKKNVTAHKVYETLGMVKDHYDLYEWMK